MSISPRPILIFRNRSDESEFVVKYGRDTLTKLRAFALEDGRALKHVRLQLPPSKLDPIYAASGEEDDIPKTFIVFEKGGEIMEGHVVNYYFLKYETE